MGQFVDRKIYYKLKSDDSPYQLPIVFIDDIEGCIYYRVKSDTIPLNIYYRVDL
mgnify:CR=1 FL=1